MEEMAEMMGDIKEIMKVMLKKVKVKGNEEETNRDQQSEPSMFSEGELSKLKVLEEEQPQVKKVKEEENSEEESPVVGSIAAMACESKPEEKMKPTTYIEILKSLTNLQVVSLSSIEGVQRGSGEKSVSVTV